MASESPGKERELKILILDNHHLCDKNQCLYNATIKSAISKRCKSNVMSFLVLFLILTATVSGVVGDGLCDPLLCTCYTSSANCSYRGFLSLPSGLQHDIRALGKIKRHIKVVSRVYIEKLSLKILINF